MKETERFYREYYAYVYAFCMRLTRNAADAEDLTEETFYRAILQANQFRGESKLGSWLCAIAKNLFYSQKRREKQKIVPPPEGEESPLAEDIFCMEDKLPSPYKEVFSLRVIEGAAFSEIASMYSKSESWARVTYMRARLQIKKLLEDENESL